MDVVAIIGGIVSAVPEAIQLWEKIAPLITAREGVSHEQVAAVEHLVPVAHNTVRNAHTALEALIATHTAV